MPEPAEPTAAIAYRGLIDSQLDDARATKASLEQRGLAVITTSGGLVTILLGIAALVKTPAGTGFSGVALAPLVGALASFGAGAVCGLVVNWPRSYDEVRIDDLRKIVSTAEVWDGPIAIGRHRTAEVLVDVAGDARRLNNTKGTWLARAMALEVLGVILLAAAVVLVLATASSAS